MSALLKILSVWFPLLLLTIIGLMLKKQPFESTREKWERRLLVAVGLTVTIVATAALICVAWR